MENKKLIAFQTVDVEGDIWCNKALVFKNEDKVRPFFENPRLVVETLGIEVKEYEDVDNCIELLETDGGGLYGAIIRLEYCGEEKILKMAGAYIIE
jgi:hypothetical protein